MWGAAHTLNLPEACTPMHNICNTNHLLLDLLLDLAQLQLLLDEDQGLVQALLRVQLLQHLRVIF